MTDEPVKVFVQRVKQPLGEFFVGAMTVRDVLAVSSFDFRRMQFKSGYVDFLGIQRRVDEGRAKKIAKYARTADAVFPTSVVLSVDDKCCSIKETDIFGLSQIQISPYIDDENVRLNIALSEAASIIDGQHRLSGLRDADALDMDLPVTIFVGNDEATDASIFSIVNLAQTKVNKSLVYDLFALNERRSPERTAHETVVSLDRMPESPFQGTIKRLGIATPGRDNETLSQATIVQGLLPYITADALADRDIGRRFGFWDPPTEPEVRRRIFRKFFVSNEDAKILAIMVNYFSAVAERWPQSWAGLSEGDILRRTNGYLGFMRFLRPAYLSLAAQSEVPSKEQFSQILKNISIPDLGFTIDRFPPGSSGAKRLFDWLLNESGLSI